MSVQTRSRSPLKTVCIKSGTSENIPSVMSFIATGTSSKQRRGEKRYSEYESGHQPKAKRHYTQSSSGTTSKEKRGTKRHLQIDDPGHQSNAKRYHTRSSYHVSVCQSTKRRESDGKMTLDVNRKLQSLGDVLPSTEYISNLFYSHKRGHYPNELKTGCQKICNEILKVENVVDVYPAYTTGDTPRFVFVVTVKKETEDIQALLKTLGYDIEIKSLEFHHTEEKNNTDDFLTKQEFTDTLRNTIRQNANNLLLKHKYLCFVRGCKYKLKTNDSNECKFEPRMALYVRAKGFIPIDEEPFEKAYDGTQVDVREGVYIPFGDHADDVHGNVRMGCRIKRHMDQPGSLGVFFEHDEYGICGITCGHVVLSPVEMKICRNSGGTLFFPNDTEVYQPEPPNAIGTLKKVICKDGDDYEAGLDIALIQLTHRKPINGKFPIGRTTQLDLEFDTGRAFEPKVEREPCYKFGSTTEYTRGIIVSTTDEPTCAKFNLTYNEDMPSYMTIHNQILVKNYDSNFADEGDSGSPVFIRACDGELVCIGIVLGGIKDIHGKVEIVLVTPIAKILQELGISKLKSFSTIDKMAKDICDLKIAVSRIEQLVMNNQPWPCVCL